jgi:hypothetical protein
MTAMAVSVASVPVDARVSKSEPTWFRAPGHFVYCAHAVAASSGSWLWCFSTVSGRWIRITDIRAGEYVKVGEGDTERFALVSRKRVTTGRDPALVGFRRTRGVTGLGKHDLYYDDRPGENSVVCSTVLVFFKCWVMGTRFWFKPDGSFRLVDR